MEKKCKWCINYFEAYAFGYISPECKIYGTLNMLQKVRHPDTEAEKCPEYKEDLKLLLTQQLKEKDNG